jgi:NodT family efflux transporter outer membrane factor (OMF) lipoprotein
MNNSNTSPAIAGATFLLLVTACSVGPTFERPTPPTVPDYDTPETSAKDVSASADLQKKPNDAQKPPPDVQKTTMGDDVPGQWWQLFKSASLDQTLRQAIADNPTLASARATLDAAKEAVLVARAGYLPKLGATTGAQRSGNGSPGPSSTETNYSLGLNASYTFNAFGGATRRLVEQQQAIADEQRFELAGSYLTLTGSVVTQVLTIASTRLQIATTLELIASDEKNLKLTRRMFEVGTAAKSDMLTAESQLAADQTALPSLEQQLSIARHALAILVGRAPGEWSAADYNLDEFTLPPVVPLSLPSELVRHRPDILAAEAQLHSASAAIGIAVAQEYPSITLSGSLTREALTAGDLFHDFDTLWNIGGSLTQPLFEGGALRAQVRGARDTDAAQAAAYRAVVLTAFGQVADDLRALEHDAARVVAYRRSLRVAADLLKLQRISYTTGTTTILQLIDAERGYAQARLGSVNADIQQLEDTVDLIVALGGGWWNTDIAKPG